MDLQDGDVAQQHVLADLDHFPYPFASETFDLIWCDGILEHLIDVVQAMDELYRIARPNARLVIITPYFTSLDAPRSLQLPAPLGPGQELMLVRGRGLTATPW